MNRIHFPVRISTLTKLTSVLALSTAVGVQASSLNLDFTTSGGTILDGAGVGTGFTARLPGTGSSVPTDDPNLTLDTSAGHLMMHTSPGVDFNGGVGLDAASTVGINLSSLGFSGSQDFTASATFVNITNLTLQPDQLCLVVGTDASTLIRAGFINFSDFHTAGTDANEGFGVNTQGGTDVNPRFFGTVVGNTMTVDISRIGGNWSVLVNGIDRMPNTAADGTGTPAPPTFLDGASDLFVGVVAMDVGNDSPWNANLDSFSVSVVPEPTSLTLIGMSGLLGAWLMRRRSKS